MKNILIINMGNSFGGVEVHIGKIIEYINKSKFKLHIMCREGSTFHKYLNEFRGDKINIEIIPCNFSKSHILSIFRLIKGTIRKYNIHLVHTHGIMSSFLYAIMKLKKIKFISTTHGYCEFDRIGRSKAIIVMFNIMEKFSLKRSDLCIAVSRDIADYISKRSIDSKKMRVINHGIEIANNKTRNSNIDNIIKIKSLGRLDKVKSFDTLIKSIKLCLEMTDKKIICEIAGDGPEYNYLSNLIKDNGLESSCKLVGFVKDTNSFLKDGYIYVQSSLIESFGISILEAMNKSLPVIATGVGGIKDIIDDEVNGLLFKTMDYEMLAKKILYLIDNNEKRTDLINNAEIILEKKFNIKDRISDLEKLYDTETYRYPN